MRSNLSPDAVAVLRVLAGSPSDLGVAAVAVALGWSEPKARRVLSRLNGREVLARWTKPAGGRGHWLYYLTMPSRARLAEAKKGALDATD